MPTYLWEKNSGAGWVPFEGTPTAQNPTEDFDEGTWSVRATVTDGAQSGAQTRTGYVTVTAAPSYTGPLDLVPGAVFFVSNRAAGSAYVGDPLYTIERTVDDTTQEFDSDASGDAPVSSISTFVGSASFQKTVSFLESDGLVTLPNLTNVKVGQLLSGTGIAAGTFITAIDVENVAIQISPATLSEQTSVTLTFTQGGIVTTLNEQINGLSMTTEFGVHSWNPSVQNSRSGIAMTGGGSTKFEADSFSVPCNGGAYTIFCAAPYRFNAEFNGGDLSAYAENADQFFYATNGAGNEAAGGAAVVADNTIHIFEFVWEFGSRAFLIDGVAQDVDSFDSGGAVGDLTLTEVGFSISNIGGAFTKAGFEFGLWPQLMSAPNRLAIRQNMQAYFGTPALP